MPNKLRKYGVTDETYRAQRLAGNKWCSNCRQFLTADRFSAEARGVCSECQKISAKKWHLANKERARAAMKASYQANIEENRRVAKEKYHALSPTEKKARGRKWSLKRKYGITEQWYVDQLAKQGGVCAICGEHAPTGKYAEYMAIDHDHQSGKPRGILCGGCNTGIGWLDKSEWVPKAMQYLQQFS
jgi:Recombination endonuclease VII